MMVANETISCFELLCFLTTLKTIIVRYQVDPACSHMLVPKIKPCMSKYKSLYGETANGSLYQL